MIWEWFVALAVCVLWVLGLWRVCAWIGRMFDAEKPTIKLTRK
jgi:hypothetical protein